jgi:catechol 2,3-dioxygenase-like lactoylglutathione lyase family enzyme
MSPRIGHLLETSLYVRDLDLSRQFYERVFALEVLLRDDRMVALAVPGGAVLLLFDRAHMGVPQPSPGGVIPAHGGSGQQHLCFAIPVAALGDWDRHLAEGGVAVESRVIQTHGGTSLYFRDPDGHSLEVATPGLWATY